MKAGKAFMEKKQYEAAVQSFTEAISIKPTLTVAYIQRGKAFENLNKLEEAVQDYSKAFELDPDDEMMAYEAGRLFSALGKHIEAVHMLNYSIKDNSDFLPAYYVKIKSLLVLVNYSEAILTCDQALLIKKSALNYFNHGMVSELLKDDTQAEADYRNSILIDKNFKESYIGLAKVLARNNGTDEALKLCSKILTYNTSYTDAYYTRSGIYYIKSDLINAISDISKAIELDPMNENYYFIRAGYYFEFKQSENALLDYSKAIVWNKENYSAYYKRALIYESMNRNSESVSDFTSFLELTESNSILAENRNKAKQKIYTLNKESNKPEIVITLPVVNSNGVIEVAFNEKSIRLQGKVSDKSLLASIKINDKDVNFDKNSNNPEFTLEISLDNTDKILIAAADIYNNLEFKSIKIVKTEIDGPVIGILAPFTSDYDEIFVPSEAPMLFIEGKLADQSLIKSIFIDSVEAKFLSDVINPDFSANINIAGKKEIKVTAIDVYGNKREKIFKLDRESAKILAENPMGKTWVIFIENSDYADFASLVGPSKDVSTMRSALSKYDIHNTIVKKNLSKEQMDKFFAIELRNLVKKEKVNSILIWYAGHGKFINETGYWIPIDAKIDDEYSYFSVNNLKASIQQYTSTTTHVLVITDACESGPSFYAAMRGAKKTECGDFTPTRFKSSQVFSSAGNELAADNSPFTKTFAKSLDYNNKSCITIDDIVVSVTESIGQGTKQSPRFGKIQGLDDEDGTFFFMKKTK